MKTLKPTLSYLLIGCMSFFGIACKKSEDIVKADQNSIPYILKDNFNLSSFTAAITRGNFLNTLSEKGPFTVLAPSDAAFQAAGYINAADVSTASASLMASLVNSHLLIGLQDIGKMPIGFNQEVNSREGKMFITHWVNGKDTILTINGAHVLQKNVPASNGLIHIIDRILKPFAHTKVGDAIASEDNLTLFSRALLRSGLLKDAGPYTVFAPDNTAMRDYGYQTIDQIDEADLSDLQDLVKAQVGSGRNFFSDYDIHGTKTSTSAGEYYLTAVQETLDGQQINISVMGGLGWAFIEFYGASGAYAWYENKLDQQDIVAGNGVVHVLNAVMK